MNSFNWAPLTSASCDGFERLYDILTAIGKTSDFFVCLRIESGFFNMRATIFLTAIFFNFCSAISEWKCPSWNAAFPTFHKTFWKRRIRKFQILRFPRPCEPVAGFRVEVGRERRVRVDRFASAGGPDPIRSDANRRIIIGRRNEPAGGGRQSDGGVVFTAQLNGRELASTADPSSRDLRIPQGVGDGDKWPAIPHPWISCLIYRHFNNQKIGTFQYLSAISKFYHLEECQTFRFTCLFLIF